MHPIDAYLLVALLNALLWWCENVPFTAYIVAALVYGFWKYRFLFGDGSARSSPAAEK